MSYTVPVFNRPTGRPPTVVDPAIRLSAAADGLTIDILVAATGCSRASARATCSRLSRAGRIFGRRDSGLVRHYFDTAERAASYMWPQPAPKPPRPPRVRKSRAKAERKPKPQKPVKAKAQPKIVKRPARTTSLRPITEQTIGNGWRNLRDPIPAPRVTSKTVRIVLPSAPVYARHQVAPGVAVPSVVDSAQCRPWAAVAAAQIGGAA